MATLNTWNNDDGLNVEFGRDRIKGAQVGKSCKGGLRQEVTCILEASRMDLTGGVIGERPNVLIPAGSYIESALLVVTEAFDSGSTATLDLGLANADGTYTGLDEDGIDAAIAESAIDTAGKEVTCDGAYIGAITTKAGYPSYDIDTAVYTTGKGYLIITYIPAFMSATAAD